jgi:protein phosphatase PTC1
MLAYESGNAVATRHSSSSELVIRSESIDSDTEFLILASNGIWEVSFRVL